MSEKILGDTRRQLLVDLLQKATRPLPGRALGERMNVSRQVIVGDITLLKAKGYPIIATSRGYVYVHDEPTSSKITKTIVCQHQPEDTEKELHILVDNGCTVKDVKIEHPVYGDLSASIMVSNRREVEQFIEKIQAVDATYLLDMTENGVHSHTIEAETEEDIIQAENDLKRAGILVDETTNA